VPSGEDLLACISRRRTNQWISDGGGYSKFSVIGAMGRAASIGVFVD